MVQIFSARTDRRLRRAILVVLTVAAAAGGLGFYHFRSDAYWGVGRTAEQPIGFRHDLHVSELGLDCGFCHSGAAREAAAGMPGAETCLICHRHVWRGTRATGPLFTSVELGQPIAWKSLYRLPGHARFHHGAHAGSGVSCAACHGDVPAMAQTKKAKPMSMAWCVDCHRRTGEARRGDAPERLARANPRLTDCSVCHY